MANRRFFILRARNRCVFMLFAAVSLDLVPLRPDRAAHDGVEIMCVWRHRLDERPRLNLCVNDLIALNINVAAVVEEVLGLREVVVYLIRLIPLVLVLR